MTDAPTRPALSRDLILRTAIALADRAGMGGLTMRSLAAELGVEAMSLYHHVANKEALLDGVADAVMAEIHTAAEGLPAARAADWKAALRRRILTAREIMLRHPWAPGVLESRTAVSPHAVRYVDGVIGLLRLGGLSHDLVHHAMHALGSRAFGFSQELFDPAGPPGGDADEVTAELLAQMAADTPHLVAMLADVAHDDPGSTLGWCDDQSEFEFALDLLLDGIAARAAADTASGSAARHSDADQ